MAQQPRLRAEGLSADRAAEVMQTVGLLVIGQAGLELEGAVALVAPVDGPGQVSAAVGHQLSSGGEGGAALEAGVGPEGAGLPFNPALQGSRSGFS